MATLQERKKSSGGVLTLAGNDVASKNTDLQNGANVLTPQFGTNQDALLNAMANYREKYPNGSGGTGYGNGNSGWGSGYGNGNWNPGSTIKPGSYDNAYSTTINDLINQAINRQPFSYDPATDQAYQAYARMYKRLGDEAGRDTLADVASNTGGLASSYAVTASNQARSAYNQALTDKIPELMQLAYDRYRNEYQDLLSGIGTLQDVSNSLYGRYSDQRDFDESVRQYNQNYDLDKNAQEYERMLNIWNSLGYANSEVAKYFGVPEGTRTDESQYRWAQYALSQAKSSGSGGGGGGRKSGGGSGGGGGNDGGLSDEDRANIMKGETNQAINVLNAFGKYLAQGGMTPEKQASALRSFKTSTMFTNLNEYEQSYVLAKLNGYI